MQHEDCLRHLRQQTLNQSSTTSADLLLLQDLQLAPQAARLLTVQHHGVRRAALLPLLYEHVVH